MKTLLHVENLSISFLKDGAWNPTVHDVNYDLQKGKTLCIVGESGSGKSVSSLALLGLLPEKISRVDSGTAHLKINETTIDLLDKSAHSEYVRGKHIGMIFQEPMTSLNPVYTCGNQMTEVLSLHLNLSQEDAKKTTLDWFEKVDLPQPDRIFASYPHELSGGQRQRVMIAMAMCCQPEILIADEPTTALDVTVQKKVLELIQDLQKEHETAVIFISHDLGVVQHLADDIMVMRKGEIQEYGSASQVFNSPKSPYTQGLINCKPDNTPKELKLLTVENALKGNHERELRKDMTTASQVLYKIENISKSFYKKSSGFFSESEEIKALQSVSFNILRNESLGLVGESGCGKSTLSKIISGLLDADSGTLVYDQTDITNYKTRDWKPLRSKIQFIFQDPYSALNPRLQVKQTIEEVLKKHQPDLSKEKRHNLSLKLLNDVGLPEESIYKFPHQFSGGQRQRVVIARALATNPELIIADESVSALDVSVQAQVLNLLNDLKAEYNLTYLFISHDLSVVQYMCDRIMVMKKGEILELGAADEVYQNPKNTYTQELINSSKF